MAWKYDVKLTLFFYQQVIVLDTILYKKAEKGIVP